MKIFLTFLSTTRIITHIIAYKGTSQLLNYLNKCNGFNFTACERRYFDLKTLNLHFVKRNCVQLTVNTITKHLII